MLYLICGLLLWAGAHLMPSVATGLRSRIIGAVGLQPYKGLFSLALLSALVLIVYGWQQTPPSALWNPPTGLRHLTILLMWPALVMFVAARVPGNPIKAKLGHPQLMGVGTWALAHLLANGEWRSLVLFGGLLVWSFVNIKTLNARDGRDKPAVGAHPGRALIITLVIGSLLWALLLWAHPHFTGRAVIAL